MRPHRIRLVAVLIAAAAAFGIAAAPAPPLDGGGSRILFQGADPQHTGNNALFVADSRGRGVRRLLPDLEGDLLHPDWSPDGRRIVFVVDGQTIRVARASGEDPHVVVRCATGCVGVDFPAWSPDGRSLAYTRYVTPSPAGPPAASVIVVRNLRSGKERVVAESDPGQVLDAPRWSSSGARLAVGIDRFDGGATETGSAIAVLDVASRRLHRLTGFSRYAYGADWRPGSDQLVFSVETLQFAPEPPAGPRDLYLIDADGAALRRITSLHGNRMLWQPAFAPDGRSIVATLDEPGGRRGVRVDLRTGRVERLGTPSLVMTHLKEHR